MGMFGPCPVPLPFCTLRSMESPLGGWRKWLHGQVLVHGKFNNLDLDSDLDLGSLKMFYLACKLLK